jgi:23S rRNA (adenine2503-C2)-methyltransferase
LAEQIALQGVTPQRLVAAWPEISLAEARRVIATVNAGGDVRLPHSGVRRASREVVCARGYVPTLSVHSSQKSEHDGFLKLAIQTHDARVVEAVRIPLQQQGRYSVCVSSQIGCALACTFCATGRMGLGRNLETWEIVEQVRLMRATLDRAAGERIHGVVFQGMGEPLSNFERVADAVRVLSEPSALAVDMRNITVSTAGLPAGIRRLARELPNVRLAWSLGSARVAVRSQLMPINRAHPLLETYAAVCEHTRTTGHSPLWAITLLRDVNDSEADALALADLALRFRRDTERSPRISVIPYNPIADDATDPFQRVDEASERQFREVMKAVGVFTHRRYSGGGDVAAACGQLSAKTTPGERSPAPTNGGWI